MSHEELYLMFTRKNDIFSIQQTSMMNRIQLTKPNHFSMFNIGFIQIFLYEYFPNRNQLIWVNFSIYSISALNVSAPQERVMIKPVLCLDKSV